MVDRDVLNKKSIKYYVRTYLQGIAEELKGKSVIDVPAGKGATSEILMELGATPVPFDLFPEYFQLDAVECRRVDVMEGLPVENGSADMLICQEGIEHFSDQLRAFREFNRVLRPGGKLIVTTPSYSSIASRLSYLLFESETGRLMPPNEIDDVWMSDKNLTGETYHGHYFLIGLQKLRGLGKLAGFRIRENVFVRYSRSSLLLFPFFYPLIWFRSQFVYARHMRKDKGLPKETKRSVYREQRRLNSDPANLVNKHTFLVFEKEAEISGLEFGVDRLMKTFGQD